MAAIVAGDPEAFGSWVAGAEPRIRRSLGSFAALVDTEAVVQETPAGKYLVTIDAETFAGPDGLRMIFDADTVLFEWQDQSATGQVKD